MGNFITCLLFVVGLILVVKGGDWFVDAASWIAKALNIPTFIIGATIVSIATTLPEMIVSVIAASQERVDMAIGNAVGSVTANTALIMAIAMLAMTIICERQKYIKQIIILICVASILLVSCLSGQLSTFGSILLAILFITFMTLNVIEAKKDEMSAEDKEPVNKKDLGKNILLFVIGAAAIVGGSELMVTYGEEIAIWIGVPERVVAITLVAIGTSLPELITTITSIIKKESALSIGNIIGANIIDLSLILPVCSLVSGENLPVSQQIITFDLPACLLVTLVAMIPIIIKQKASKIQGVILLAIYIGYLIVAI